MRGALRGVSDSPTEIAEKGDSSLSKAVRNETSGVAAPGVPIIPPDTCAAEAPANSWWSHNVHFKAT